MRARRLAAPHLRHGGVAQQYGAPWRAAPLWRHSSYNLGNRYRDLDEGWDQVPKSEGVDVQGCPGRRRRPANTQALLKFACAMYAEKNTRILMATAYGILPTLIA